MKHQISDTGRAMLKYQEQLAFRNKYAPIQPNLFDGDVREFYLKALPEWCCLSGGNERLCSADGTLICDGYDRIVIGDYGAFVEISPKRIVRENIKPKAGQEYRYSDERYRNNVKYIWLTTKDSSDCKIYYQQKTVDYADYRVGMCYVNPYEVFPEICDIEMESDAH